MNILLVTQKVDSADPILGFFHGWLEEFAAQCDEVHVIGQLVGTHHLPANVHVYSLGKESGLSKWRQVVRYWSYLIKLQKKCDVALVHMAPIWAVLALWCRLPLYLWYEARGTRWPLRVALWRVRKVFSASKHGMSLHTSKSVVVGHGINTNRFVPGDNKEPAHILTIGRITASKHVDDMLRMFLRLPQDFRFTIVGKAITAADQQYAVALKAQILQAGASDRVHIGALEQDAIIPLLQRASVFIHASDTSLDKAVLEAMACGCPVVSSAAAIQSILPESCRVQHVDQMANVVQHVCNLPTNAYGELAQVQRAYVVENHNLQKLVARLLQEM